MEAAIGGKLGLREYIESKSANCTIWFTGHSLGDALATLAAFRYENARGTYTFGSPRVGDKIFKNAFHTRTYRFVNNCDIITRMPPPVLYKHVGELKYIDSNGVIDSESNRWERITNPVLSKISHVFNSLGRTGGGLSVLIPDDIVDHVPTLYATHIWNNIP